MYPRERVCVLFFFSPSPPSLLQLFLLLLLLLPLFPFLLRLSTWTIAFTDPPPCRDSLCPFPSFPSFYASPPFLLLSLYFLSASLSLSLCPPHVRPSHSSLPSFSSFSLRAFLVVSLARVCVSFARRDAYCEYYSPSDVAHVRSSPPSTLLRFINPEGRTWDIDIAAHDRGPIRWTPSLRASLRSFSPIFIPIV